MLKLALAGAFFSVAAVVLAPRSADAAALDLLLKNTERTESRAVIAAVAPASTTIKPVAAHEPLSTEESAPEITKHTVADGESLISVAKQHNVADWRRLFDKNTSIENPDQLDPGMEIVIPADDEDLERRALPAPVVVAPVQRTVARSTVSAPVTSAIGSSDGNRYVAGYCTWYVKGRRPDLPNNLGNAATWVSRAAAQGIPTGSAPRVGAVGQRGNHVVYVESVNADGTVTVSEMNRRRLYEKTTRTEPASHFRYIY